MERPKLPPTRPDGKLEVITTYLEMHQPPRHGGPTRMGGRELKVIRAKPPTVSFYRYLYNTVGGPWLWWERRAMEDRELAAIVQNDDVEVHVLYVDGCPAGYGEIDRRRPEDAELSYFGLVPDFLGQGLGLWFLGRALDVAWSAEARRVWVHTCSLDHPRALLVYQRLGFVAYDEVPRTIEDPRLSGLFPELDR
jgi:GNAT superfamily N-acetyltransferase